MLKIMAEANKVSFDLMKVHLIFFLFLPGEGKQEHKFSRKLKA